MTRGTGTPAYSSNGAGCGFGGSGSDGGVCRALNLLPVWWPFCPLVEAGFALEVVALAPEKLVWRCRRGAAAGVVVGFAGAGVAEDFVRVAGLLERVTVPPLSG